jgi:hypothetical protein
MTKQWNWSRDLISIPFICIVMLAFDLCYYTIILINSWLFPNHYQISLSILFVVAVVYSSILGILFIHLDPKHETS